jgi:hypothetical protein
MAIRRYVGAPRRHSAMATSVAGRERANGNGAASPSNRSTTSLAEHDDFYALADRIAAIDEIFADEFGLASTGHFTS